MRQPARLTIVIGLLVTCIGSTATAQSVVTGAITGTLTDAGKKAVRTVERRGPQRRHETRSHSDERR